jgi:iron complex outermembrane receptor protein
MGLPDVRAGNPATQGTLGNYVLPSTLGNVLPVAATNVNGPAAGPFQSLPGACPPERIDGAFCRWDRLDYTDLQPRIERFNVFARGTYQVNDSTQAYAELSWFRVATDIHGTPAPTRAAWYNPATLSITSSLNIYLPVGHPDNPFSSNNQVARLFYADAANGGMDRDYRTDTQRYLAGFKGRHAQWDRDVAALYIRSDTDITLKNAYSYDRLLPGLAGTGPYGYYRIGSAAVHNDPAVYDWIAPDRSWSALSENTIVDAKASRDLYKLDGGQLALAVGYEFHREEISNPGVPGTETGNVVGASLSRAVGSRSVNATYAELYAPLLGDLETTVALRYDHYSDVGSTVNPKVGVKWTALPSLVLRGTWQTAFRAPGIYETGGTSGGVAGGYDPVRCPETGLPADCQTPRQLYIVTPGPDLQPETSTSYTLGLIWEPVPGLSGTLDYWNFVTKNTITTLEGEAVRDTNNLPGIPNSGTILYVLLPTANAVRTQTDGIDLDITWRQPLGEWGTLTSQFQWTHVFKYSITDPNDGTYRFDGTQGPGGLSSQGGTPTDRMNLIVGWRRGPWDGTGTVRYVSDYDSVYYRGYKEDTGFCISGLDGPNCHVSSFTTLDLSGQYSGFRNWQIFGSVINVFNRIAPFNPAAAFGFVNYNYNYAFSGATGTQFNLGARYTFQ